MQESTELNLWTVNKTFWTLIIGPDRFPLFPSVWGCRIGLHSRRQLEHESKRALLTPPPDSQRQSTRGESTAYQEDGRPALGIQATLLFISSGGAEGGVGRRPGLHWLLRAVALSLARGVKCVSCL